MPLTKKQALERAAVGNHNITSFFTPVPRSTNTCLSTSTVTPTPTPVAGNEYTVLKTVTTPTPTSRLPPVRVWVSGAQISSRPPGRPTKHPKPTSTLMAEETNLVNETYVVQQDALDDHTAQGSIPASSVSNSMASALLPYTSPQIDTTQPDDQNHSMDNDMSDDDDPEHNSLSNELYMLDVNESPESIHSTNGQPDGFVASPTVGNPLKRLYKPEKTIHLFGKVELEQPDHLIVYSLDRLKNMLEDLAEFEARDMTLEAENTKTVEDLFQQLTIAEHDITGRKKQHLVKTSGVIQARLINHLHYPSFCTDTKDNGEVFDPSNPCLELLAGTGMNKDNAFWLDGFCRRESREWIGKKMILWKAEKYYTPELIALHRKYVCEVRAQLQGKVEIIYGKPERQRFIAETSRRATVISKVELWGAYEGLTINLVRSPDKFLPSGRRRIERIVLFSHHPEWYMYNASYAPALMMDRLLNLAFELASIDLHTDYFTERSLALGYTITGNQDMSQDQNATSKKPKKHMSGTGLHSELHLGIKAPTRPRKGKANRVGDYGTILIKAGRLEIAGEAAFTWATLPPSVTRWFEETLNINSDEDVWSLIYGPVETQLEIVQLLKTCPKLKSGTAKGLPQSTLLAKSHPQYFTKTGKFKLGASVKDVADSVGIDDRAQAYFEERDGYLYKARIAGRDLLCSALNSLQSRWRNTVLVDKQTKASRDASERSPLVSENEGDADAEDE